MLGKSSHWREWYVFVRCIKIDGRCVAWGKTQEDAIFSEKRKKCKNAYKMLAFYGIGGV